MENIDFWGFCLEMEKIFKTNESIFYIAFEHLCLKMSFHKNRTIVLKTLKSCIKQSILYIILYRHQGNPWYHYVHVKYLTKRNKCAGCVFFLY